MQLTRTHRILIGVVVAGAVVIAGIGFAGSYAAVRALALKKGFGNFSLVFPIGIDMGIRHRNDFVPFFSDEFHEPLIGLSVALGNDDCRTRSAEFSIEYSTRSRR